MNIKITTDVIKYIAEIGDKTYFFRIEYDDLSDLYICELALDDGSIYGEEQERFTMDEDGGITEPISSISGYILTRVVFPDNLTCLKYESKENEYDLL